MPHPRKTVVIGFLGTNLDSQWGPNRWQKWRPTLSLCQQDDLKVDRFHLLIDGNFETLAEHVKEDITLVSPETEVIVHKLSIRDAWDFQDVYEALHDFCQDYDFDQTREDYLAHMTTGTHVAQICLFLLTEAHYLPGKLIQTSPPFGRLAKKQPGVGKAEIIDLDLSRYDRLATRFTQEQAQAQDFLRSGIATRNEQFNRLIAELEVVALRSKAPLHLTGPTGAGKSQLARRVYELRQQRSDLQGEFVEINCATLRGDTAMSTLFGHRKGAFTGAQADRPGVLRQAHNGMLFLDEIGELGSDEQAMLLRALEEGTFLPVGSDTPVKSKFQLITGTNRDLRSDVSSGSFREDLLARINLWTFDIPGLAERREDIAPNINYELKRYSESEGRVASFNTEAEQKFLRFAEAADSPWRGNFRDLNAAITRMATLAERGRIREQDVDLEILRLQRSWQRNQSESETTTDLSSVFSDEALNEIDPFDRVQLAHVISVSRKSKSLSDAGRSLFAASRKKKKNPNDADRLKKYLAKFELTFAAL